MIETQEPGVRIIDKTGPLANPADRDHCIQYMVAIPLIFGRLTAADYEDEVAADPRIDALRAKMEVRRGPALHAGVLRRRQALHRQRGAGVLPGWLRKRALGHRRRRAEGIPLLREKALAAFAAHYGKAKAGRLMALFADRAKLEAPPVHDFVSQFTK